MGTQDSELERVGEQLGGERDGEAAGDERADRELVSGDRDQSWLEARPAARVDDDPSDDGAIQSSSARSVSLARSRRASRWPRGKGDEEALAQQRVALEVLVDDGLGLWQNHIERILAGWVAELPVTFHRGREVTRFVQDDTHVDVRTSDGQLRAKYLVGCDGGRSLIRRAAGIEFPGWDPTTSSLIAQVEMAEEPELGIRRDALRHPRPGQGGVRDPGRRGGLPGGGLVVDVQTGHHRGVPLAWLVHAQQVGHGVAQGRGAVVGAAERDLGHRGAQHAGTEWVALGVVGVQEARRRYVVDHLGQLPPQVHRVLHTGAAA
jgi:2-polyprenyl-6-methoxyphenol hydroxylase-like FAD-dependent oxidoreductase